MHTKSNNVEIMIGSETNEIIEDLYESLIYNIIFLIYRFIK